MFSLPLVVSLCFAHALRPVSGPASDSAHQLIPSETNSTARPVALFNPDFEINTAVQGLLKRKNLDPADFFAHWADNGLHSVFADFNNDGRLEAAFSGRLSSYRNKIEIWRNNGLSWSGPFLLEQSYTDSHLTIYDINHDGFVDLIAIEPLSHLVVSAWLGSAAGTFTPCRDISSLLLSTGSVRLSSGLFRSLAIALPERLKHYSLLLRTFKAAIVSPPSGFYSCAPTRILGRLMELRISGRSPPIL